MIIIGDGDWDDETGRDRRSKHDVLKQAHQTYDYIFTIVCKFFFVDSGSGGMIEINFSAVTKLRIQERRKLEVENYSRRASLKTSSRRILFRSAFRLISAIHTVSAEFSITVILTSTATYSDFLAQSSSYYKYSLENHCKSQRKPNSEKKCEFTASPYFIKSLEYSTQIEHSVFKVITKLAPLVAIFLHTPTVLAVKLVELLRAVFNLIACDLIGYHNQHQFENLAKRIVSGTATHQSGTTTTAYSSKTKVTRTATTDSQVSDRTYQV